MPYIPQEPTWLKTLRRTGNVIWPGWLRLRMHPYPAQFSRDMDLPAVPDRPVRFWLMATTPRSGSHFLGHAIGSAGHFGFPLEYLNPMNLDLWRHRFRLQETSDVFQQLYHHRSGPTGLFGVKAHWNQYTGFSYHSLFDDHGGFEKAIWLYRRNLLKQSISRVFAQQTGQWIGGARRRGTLNFDYAAIVKNARMIRRQNENWARYFASDFHAPVKKLVFEDIVADPETVFAEIRNFLDPKAPESAIFRSQTDKQSNETSKEWYRLFKSELQPEDDWIVTPQSF